MTHGSTRSGPEDRRAGFVHAGRLRRCILLAGLGIAFAASASDSKAGPAPRQVAFDSLVVSPASFSPNGDRVFDSVTITYRLADTTIVNIHVTPSGSSQIVRTILNGTLAPRPQTSIWNGSKDPPDSTIVADGDYVIHLEGLVKRNGVLLSNQRVVRVDTRAAIASIDTIAPAVYTPAVPGTPSPPRVGVQVSQSQPGDSLNVRLQVPGPPARTLRLRLQQNRQDLQGDGFYWAVCDSCGAKSIPDGIYPLTAVTRDAAGNSFTSTAQIDKDILGPHLTIRHPVAGSIAHVQHADSLVGTAYDRHGVGSIQVFVGADTVPFVAPGSVPPGDSVYVFRSDISSRFATEGRYRLRLHAFDGHGVAGETAYELVVDRTAPARPQLDPRPGPVSKTDRLDVRLRIDPDDLPYQVIRTGGAGAADTTRLSSSGRADLLVLLRPGANPLTFAVRDSALNVSPPETLTVVWETSRGLAAPERFEAGGLIQLNMGPVAGAGVEVLVYATDGSQVNRFVDDSRKLIYEFTWNLENPEGLRVKNGAYLLVARVRNADGSVERWRKLIAVLE